MPQAPTGRTADLANASGREEARARDHEHQDIYRFDGQSVNYVDSSVRAAIKYFPKLHRIVPPCRAASYPVICIARISRAFRAHFECRAGAPPFINDRPRTANDYKSFRNVLVTYRETLFVRNRFFSILYREDIRLFEKNVDCECLLIYEICKYVKVYKL